VLFLSVRFFQQETRGREREREREGGSDRVGSQDKAIALRRKIADTLKKEEVED
jgi:hypothetical protein